MTVYSDTSVLVSFFSDETSSDVAARWFATLQPGELVSSPWVDTEFTAAVAAKARAGLISREERNGIITDMRKLVRLSARLVPVEQRHFRAASTLPVLSPKPLRGADALHLAIAAEVADAVVTFDKGMAAAGQALGLDVQLLGA